MTWRRWRRSARRRCPNVRRKGRSQLGVAAKRDIAINSQLFPSVTVHVVAGGLSPPAGRPASRSRSARGGPKKINVPASKRSGARTYLSAARLRSHARAARLASRAFEAASLPVFLSAVLRVGWSFARSVSPSIAFFMCIDVMFRLAS